MEIADEVGAPRPGSVAEWSVGAADGAEAELIKEAHADRNQVLPWLACGAFPLTGSDFLWPVPVYRLRISSEQWSFSPHNGMHRHSLAEVPGGVEPHKPAYHN